MEDVKVTFLNGGEKQMYRGKTETPIFANGVKEERERERKAVSEQME